MHELIAHLTAGGPVVTDGAWGTQLQQRGLEPGECPDAWNLGRPECVEAVACAYVAAGSRIILTNTFGANRFVLARHGLAEEVAAVNRAGVVLSRQAAAAAPDGRQVWVFATMGPSGLMMMSGQVGEGALYAAFAEQAAALADAGADALVVETMADPAEARLAVAAGRATGLPVVGCMTFDSGKDGCHTMMGTTPEQGAAVLLDAGADIVGANCGQGIAGFLPICQRLHAASGRPVWIKANAGMPVIVEDGIEYRQTPEDFAAAAPELVAAGAGFLGGCCGTTPEFVRALCRRLGE